MFGWIVKTGGAVGWVGSTALFIILLLFSSFNYEEMPAVPAFNLMSIINVHAVPAGGSYFQCQSVISQGAGALELKRYLYLLKVTVLTRGGSTYDTGV